MIKSIEVHIHTFAQNIVYFLFAKIFESLTDKFG